jgi:hypothetical protein
MSETCPNGLKISIRVIVKFCFADVATSLAWAWGLMAMRCNGAQSAANAQAKRLGATRQQHQQTQFANNTAQAQRQIT